MTDLNEAEQYLLVAVNEYGDETAFLRFRKSDPAWKIKDFVEVVSEWAENNPDRTLHIRAGEP